MGLFRQAALNRIASPERLDEMVRVTSPLGWLALATVGALLAGVVAWGIVGSIPTRVDGKGILAAGDYYWITAPADGEIVELFVQVDDRVLPNQRVAAIVRPSDDVEVRRSQSEYSSKRESYLLNQRMYSANVVGWNQQIAMIEEAIREQQGKLQQLNQRLDNPNVPKNTTLREIEATGNGIDRLKRDILNVEQQKRAARSQLEMLGQQAELAASQLQLLGVSIEQATVVSTTVGGTIVEVKKRVGDPVSRGEILARQVRGWDEADYRARFYVNADVGVDIKPGMDVEISPKNVKREEHGFIKGKVVERSRETLDQTAILRELGGDDQRAKEITKLGPVYRVEAVIEGWSSGEGVDLEDNQGITVNVITKTRRPYELVAPFVKKKLGTS